MSLGDQAQLHIREFTAPDGRRYKVVGVHLHQVEREALKVDRFLAVEARERDRRG